MQWPDKINPSKATTTTTTTSFSFSFTRKEGAVCMPAGSESKRRRNRVKTRTFVSMTQRNCEWMPSEASRHRSIGLLCRCTFRCTSSVASYRLARILLSWSSKLHDYILSPKDRLLMRYSDIDMPKVNGLSEIELARELLACIYNRTYSIGSKHLMPLGFFSHLIWLSVILYYYYHEVSMLLFNKMGCWKIDKF